MATLTDSLAIGYLNHASGKTITSTTAATGYPASNLNSPRLSSSHRTTAGSLSNQNIDVDLESSKDVDIIALIGTNLTDTATVSPAAGESSGFSSNVEYSPGVSNAFDNSYSPLVPNTNRYGRNLIVLPGATLNSRYFRLQISNAGNPDNFISSRVYWAGPLWQPTISFAGREGTFKKRRELVGEPGIERYLTFLDVMLDVLTEAEGTALESLCASRLRSGRLLVIPRPTQPATWQSEALYCTLTGLPTLTGWPQGGGLIYWKVSLTFKECED